ncbi:unnamed protein product [Mytilus coruscus]|uniref:SGNH hydrolase-type esterase domain-containing protein n=1 Tax=Mytilus coruscus TaxID=42192 RepID=A0A6J8A5J1_MYTCO|nr:unnamed protein product [Mytilus coruscus]
MQNEQNKSTCETSIEPTIETLPSLNENETVAETGVKPSHTMHPTNKPSEHTKDNVNLIIGASNAKRLGDFQQNVVNASISGASLDDIDMCIHLGRKKINPTVTHLNKIALYLGTNDITKNRDDSDHVNIMYTKAIVKVKETFPKTHIDEKLDYVDIAGEFCKLGITVRSLFDTSDISSDHINPEGKDKMCALLENFFTKSHTPTSVLETPFIERKRTVTDRSDSRTTPSTADRQSKRPSKQDFPGGS